MRSGWNKRSMPASGCTVGTELSLYHWPHVFIPHSTVWPLWSGGTRAEQNACTSHRCIIITRPQLKLDCACGRGVQNCCFPLWWCWNTSREGTYSAVTGHGTCAVSENPDAFFYILFLNTVGYLFMWQKQGCPASAYSKYFICQVLAAL